MFVPIYHESFSFLYDFGKKLDNMKEICGNTGERETRERQSSAESLEGSTSSDFSISSLFFVNMSPSTPQ